MANDAQTLRWIDYRKTFPFISIFRSFRIAVDPSKLALALVLLLLLYACGRLMDGIWPDKYRAVPIGQDRQGEIHLYQAARAIGTDADLTPTTTDAAFLASRNATRQRITSDYRALYLPMARKPDQIVALEPADYGDTLGDVKTAIAARRDAALKAADATYAKAPKGDANGQEVALKSYNASRAMAWQAAIADYQSASRIQGEGLFITFFAYEADQIDLMATGVRNLSAGQVGGGLLNFVTVGPVWAVRYHPVYFTILFAIFLLLWAIFGGAIARIAAVQVAVDEKISLRQALLFSTSKVLSFIFAPLIPAIILAGVGLALAVAGLVTNIPGVGPVVVGIFFFLALIAGLVLALTALGLLGGVNLMYPTIAVEGSDSFDAVSRSFSYLYARPWQLGFYTLVALVYGGITYLFVRFFIFVLLKLTHLAFGALVFTKAPMGVNSFDAMWPMGSDMMNLAYNPAWFGLGTGQAIGAGLLAFWNYLVISMLGAFAVSLYFSANTIIYYLMRRDVDATDMEDVYLEQTDDDFVDAAPAGDVPQASAEPLAGQTAAGEATSADTATQGPSTDHGEDRPPAMVLHMPDAPADAPSADQAATDPSVAPPATSDPAPPAEPLVEDETTRTTTLANQGPDDTTTDPAAQSTTPREDAGKDI